MVAAKTLAPAPAHPFENNVRVLVDGDLCDAPGPYSFAPWRGCTSYAYVRVHLFRDRSKQDHIGVLHFCAHHWRDVCDRLIERELDGLCSIRDETKHLN